MSLEILGCRLDELDAVAATDRILEFAQRRAAAHVVTLGTEMIVYAQRDPEFKSIINQSALSLCDTIGLLLVARLRGSRLRERVAGVELIEDICQDAARLGLPIFLLGGTEGVAASAAAELRKRYLALQIAGEHHGYFTDEESDAIVKQIASSGAAILFAGLGFPRQEFWLARYLAATRCGAGLGIGGSFDVLSGKVKRAPGVWQRLGLEWFYRLVSEPHRWRRQLALPQFVWLVLTDSLRRRAST